MNDRIEEKEREIDVKHILLYLWNHIVIIFLVGIILAGAMGVFGYEKKKKEAAAYASPQAVLARVLAKNKDASFPKETSKRYYKANLECLEGSCVVRTQLYIDYNYNSIENSDTMDYNDIANRLQNDVGNILTSNKAIEKAVEKVNQNDYDGLADLTINDVKLLVDYNFYGANVSIFSVVDVNEERAMDISNVLVDYFMENAENYDIIDSARVIEEPILFYSTELKPASPGLKDILKYAIFGGGLGVFLMAFIYLFIYVLGDFVWAKDDIIFLDMLPFGAIRKNSGSSDYKRLAYNISLLEEKNNILIAPVDSKTDISELVETVSNELKNIKSNKNIICTNDIVNSPDMILESKKSDGVIIVARYGATSMKNLEYAKSEVQKTGKDIIGVVLKDVKYQ